MPGERALDCLSVHSKLNGEVSLADVAKSISSVNFGDELIREHLALGAPRVAAWPSSLFCRVAHVVAVCSKKQMVWSYARWVVATVTNAHAIRNWAIRDLPRDSMGETVARWANTNDAVATSVRGAFPQPTTVCFLGVLVQALLDGARMSLVLIHVSILLRSNT